jgi:phosphoglycolate phosphatase-like HAD superfamily hydrolase
MLFGLAGPLASKAFSDEPTDPLPSWRQGLIKETIIDFVDRVTTPGSEDFVPVEERIAVYDNDGTLWSEQPVYFQLFFAMDMVKAKAAEHPEWATTQPFRAVLEGDMAQLAEAGEHGVMELVVATHAGMTEEEFRADVTKWLETARHPRFDRPYPELVFQPMLELLDYMEAHGFKNFIVSGGGIDFMRVFAEEVYGIPPEQVIGSSIELEFEVVDGKPVLQRLPKIHFINDKTTKPIGIHRHIGRRPIAAFGNSDGDFQMLQWTAAGDGLSLCALVHHTDAEREWAYDRESHIGRLLRGLDEAQDRGWLVIDMKKDWKRVYPGRK